jgi:hypothetical protein
LIGLPTYGHADVRIQLVLLLLAAISLSGCSSPLGAHIVCIPFVGVGGECTFSVGDTPTPP